MTPEIAKILNALAWYIRTRDATFDYAENEDAERELVNAGITYTESCTICSICRERHGREIEHPCE